jgi:hypothetical protein
VTRSVGNGGDADACYGRQWIYCAAFRLPFRHDDFLDKNDEKKRRSVDGSGFFHSLTHSLTAYRSRCNRALTASNARQCFFDPECLRAIAARGACTRLCTSQQILFSRPLLLRPARQQSIFPACRIHGITLDEASIRWAAAEGVSETIIAAVLLLHERSVDKVAAKLRPDELQNVVRLVSRCPSCYPPGTFDALKARGSSHGPLSTSVSTNQPRSQQAARTGEESRQRHRGRKHAGRPFEHQRSATAAATPTYCPAGGAIGFALTARPRSGRLSCPSYVNGLRSIRSSAAQ